MAPDQGGATRRLTDEKPPHRKERRKDPTMTAAETYAARIDAANAQRARSRNQPATPDPWGAVAARFRFDPRRELGANLAAIASFVQPEDVLIDVGGGSGRVSLPLALRCRETINIEPSPGMKAMFESLAAEADITRASVVQANWLEAAGIQGDVVFCADVTYFVRDIVPFITKLQAAARHRVILTVWSVPPPNRRASLFRLFHREAQEWAPGYRELLAVLWDMDILPDVRVLPEPPWWDTEVPVTHEQAVELALQSVRSRPQDQERMRDLVETHFQTLFASESDGLHPLWRADARELLITWETR